VIPFLRSATGTVAMCGLVVLALGPSLAAQQSAGVPPSVAFADMTAEQIYNASCANCHGITGGGVPQNKLGFTVPPADFTDCSFASREANADWVAIVSEGGPIRGFFHMMPAFGDALTRDQIEGVVNYLHTLCGSGSWPRGDLNLPRAMVTEKAFPEDELVWTTETALRGSGVAVSELVFEKRFGPGGQFEFVAPFGFQQQDVNGTEQWQSGLGDIIFGWKQLLLHSFRSGSILSLGAELKLPTGNPDHGFGAGTQVVESFVSFGQLLPSDAFVQFQGIVEVPFDETLAEKEGAVRVALGKTFMQGGVGRSWTPMVELLGAKELEGGTTIQWDVVPQLQVTLSRRQHVMANVAARIPVNETAGRDSQLLVYLLWDWFDGGLFDGW
jgi:Cytochrome C oxidase, cbb3-type, subunit III/Putative MetA-pathway of phenol degradation